MTHKRLQLCAAVIASLSFPIHASAASALKARALPAKPLYASVAAPNLRTDVIYLKLREGVSTTADATTFKSAALADVNRILATAPGTTVTRLFARPDTQLHAEKAAGEAKLGVEMADMTLFYTLQLPRNVPAFQVEGLLNGLNRLEVVELAYVKPAAARARADIAPTTGNLYRHQTLLFGPAPSGIDAEYAWTIPGGKGAGTRYIDIEQGFRNTHEDLKDPFYIVGPYGSASSSDIQHGVNVVGLITAQHNDFGMKGIAPDAEFGFVTALNGSGGYAISAAIDHASSKLSPGDVILIEQQYLTAPHPDQQSCGCSGSKCGATPVENGLDDYTAIRNATAAGRIVVEAAGNGNVNLDAPYFGGQFNRAVRDSGAMLVGATGQNDNIQECYSNYGDRIDVNAAGSGVGTTGDGTSRFGTHIDEWYTNGFGGTSSASPFVAGSALVLQGIQKQRTSVGYSPQQMRTLLRQYGTAQQPHPSPLQAFHPLGTKPNLRGTITALSANSDGDNLSNGDELAYNCNLAAWTSVLGTVQTGTPYDSPSIRRLSEPCALRTTTLGSYVVDGTPNALAQHAYRFYVYPHAATTGPTTIFQAQTAAAQTLYSVRQNGSTFEVLNQAGAVVVSKPARVFGWNSVELRWQAGSPGQLAVEIGYVETVAGALQTTLHKPPAVSVGTATDRIEEVRIGQIAGGTPVTMTFDAFRSGASYATRIGRLLRGDANRDGGVSGPDIVLITNEAGGGALAYGQPDCNEDGGVSGPDIVCVTRLANGLDVDVQ